MVAVVYPVIIDNNYLINVLIILSIIIIRVLMVLHSLKLVIDFLIINISISI